MDRALKEWFEYLKINSAPAADSSKLKLSYTKYGCMLLLSHNAFENPAWQELRTRCTNDHWEHLYTLLAKHLQVTHIAINKPIPQALSTTENIIRSPQNFTPLFGDFGPTTSSSPPAQQDFDDAFWVTAKQNGIYQTWAPRWTMFSRGNISEKARLLTLPSIQTAVNKGRADGRRCAAVDLYAGIGYFAFSYLKAGVEKVLCWDINPWSIEGLKRGANANKWKTIAHEALKEPTTDALKDDGSRLMVFPESNEYAFARMQKLRTSLPPVRHVNCGLLPTSKPSWETAFDVLDEQLGGWLHVHENFALEEIKEKAEAVRKSFQAISASRSRNAEVELEFVNRLKSYAPGVMHCVLDIYVPPFNPG